MICDTNAEYDALNALLQNPDHTFSGAQQEMITKLVRQGFLRRTTIGVALTAVGRKAANAGKIS